MPNEKISQLPLATSPLDSTVEMPVVQGGVTKRAGMTTIGFLQSGTGAVLRTAQDKMREEVSAKDFGAVSDGATNDSAAYTAAVAAGSNVVATSGQFSAIKDVALSSSDSYFGGGTRLIATAGAVNLFTLDGFNSRAQDFYVAGSTACSQATIRMKEGRYTDISGVINVNTGAGFVHLAPTTPASQFLALPQISNCHAEDITSVGLFMGSSVSELFMTNFHLYGKLVASTGGDKPTPSSVGWRQNTPVLGGFAVGGHQLVNLNMITFDLGFYLTDAQLSFFSNIIADSCSGYGLLVDGASSEIKFADLFVGTTRGIKIAGTSSVWIDGLYTKFNGLIPPWGSTDFFNGVTTFYDVEVRDTATLQISNWKGDKRIFVDPTAKLLIDGGTRFFFRTTSTIGAGTTNYLAEWGATPTEADTIWRAPCAGQVVGFSADCTAAPGAGQSFTYTVRKSFADTTLTGSISGAAGFATEVWCGTAPIAVNRGDTIALKLVTSAGATATRHNGSVLFLPD